MGDFRNYVTKLSWPFLCTKQLLFVYLILQFMVLLAEGGSFSYSLLLNYGLSHCWDFHMLHSCSFWCYWLSSYLCDKLRHIGQEGQSVRTFHSEGIANGKLGFRSIDLTGSSSRMGNSSDGDSEPHHATHTGLLQGRSATPAQTVAAGIHAIRASRVSVDLLWHYPLVLLDF